MRAIPGDEQVFLVQLEAPSVVENWPCGNTFREKLGSKVVVMDGRMSTFESCHELQIRNVFSDYNYALC